MPFLTQGKTNWKFIAIVAVLAVIVGGGTLLLSKFNQTAIFPIEPQKPEEVERSLGPYPAPHIEVEATVISVFLDNKMRLPDVLPQDKIILRIDEIIDRQYGKNIDIQVGDEIEMGLQYSARPAKLLWDLPPICPEGYELVLSGCAAEARVQDLDMPILAPKYEDRPPRLEQNFIVYSKPQKPEDYLEGRVKERVLPGIEQGDKIRIIVWDSLYPIGVYELVEVDKSQMDNDWLIENEIVNWQTYRNKEYGLEFKYPPDFVTHEQSSNFAFSGKEMILYLVLYGSSPIDTPEKRAEIENLNKSSYAPYLNTVYLTQEFKEIYLQNKKAIEVSTIFNDTPPDYYELSPPVDWGSGEHRIVFFSCREYVCSIRTHFKKENKDQNEILFNQILSTFRFLE